MEMLTFYISGIQVDTLMQAYNEWDSTTILNRYFVKMDITHKKGDLRKGKKRGMWGFFLDNMIIMRVWCSYFCLLSLSYLLSVI